MNSLSNDSLVSNDAASDSPGMAQRQRTVTGADPVERLQDLVLTRLRELGDENGPMSAREAARRADGLISYESLRLLARGHRHTGRITDRTAEGLSRALQVPIARVYTAAGIPTPGERWDWPARFARLNPAQRGLVEELAAALLESYDKGRRDLADELQRLDDENVSKP